MAKGKGKGSEFERQICKTLSLWWTDQERDDVYWRSSNSGGRATVRSRQNQGTFGQYGDVQATDPIGQPLIDFCTIEIKRGYGKASVGDVFDKTPTSAQQPWETWALQAIEDHEKAGSAFWMLITKRDRRGIVIIMPLPMYALLNTVGATLNQARPWLKLNMVDRMIGGVFGTSLDEFLSHVSADNIEKALRGTKWGINMNRSRIDTFVDPAGENE